MSHDSQRPLGGNVWRGLPVALGVALAGAAHAQDAASETRCYQFDRPYFGQVRAAAGLSLPTPDTSAFDRWRAEVRAVRATRRDTPDPLLDYLVDSVREERTAIARLEPAPADAPPFVFPPDGMNGTRRPGTEPRRLVPVFTLPEVTRRDVQGQVLFRRWGHYWRPLPDDSLQISWYNGFHGPVFRVAIRGDSLVGTVVHQSDFIRTDSVTGGMILPARLPARAVRVACAPPSPA